MELETGYRLVSLENAEHYTWGEVCDGWHLVRHSSLSVIEEQMPSGATEVRHAHRYARQFFYVLEGVLGFEVDGSPHYISAGTGIEIAPGAEHRVFTNAGAARFLVVSQPPSHGDRLVAAP